jgi:hypothetical protein
MGFDQTEQRLGLPPPGPLTGAAAISGMSPALEGDN